MAKGNITIKQLENGCFEVSYDDKRTGDLSFDEMLGLVASITMPQNAPVCSGSKQRNGTKRRQGVTRQWRPSKEVRKSCYHT